VIMGVFPHLWARTGVGQGDASVELLNPMDTAGFVLFDWNKANNQPDLVENDYNKATIFAAPNNTQRTKTRGKTWTSENQLVYQQNSMLNVLQTVHLPARSVFRVLFQLMPPAATNPIPNPYVIGTPGANQTLRIDFAGAMVHGVRMPSALYGKLKKARQAGQLGPEATASYETPGSLPGTGPTRWGK
jgi:hypothetical protein